ncbi:hypothetical protein DB354_12825 [Opitutus sp. ER46]|nr:hypothetical protein DB354_12825 [Opitutus sp. ER46]
MSHLAYLLPPQRSFSAEADFMVAGIAALLIATAYYLIRRKKEPVARSYSFWLFLGSGVGLVVLSFVLGSSVPHEAIFD